MLKMSTSLRVLCQRVSKIRGSFVNWTCGKLSIYNSPVRLSFQKLLLVSYKAFKKVRAWLSRMISEEIHIWRSRMKCPLVFSVICEQFSCSHC